MKTQLTIIAFMLITSSCASQPREITSKSNIKLEGRNTTIRNLIDIDGYYQRVDDTNSRSAMMFFEDGMHFSIIFKEDITEEIKRKKLSQAIISWKQKGQVQWGSYCGVYKIDEDTIVVQTVEKAGWFSMPWSFDEVKYEIIDRQTLKLISLKYLYPTDKNNKKRNPYEISKKNFIDKFVPADSLPSSDCWLKKEKWIWRNESDWKDYMEKIKQKKKK